MMTRPPQPIAENVEYIYEMNFFKNGAWKAAGSNIWPMHARTSYRQMLVISAKSSNSNGPTLLDSEIDVPVEARIVASAAGTLDYPGLPLANLLQPLFLGSNQWHRIIVKVGPDAAVVARGVRLRLNSGASGQSPAQAGIEFKHKTSTSFDDYVPGEILEGSPMYDDLTSREGLVLFVKIQPSFNQLHRLCLDLLPNGATLEPLEIQKLDLLPVEFKVVKEGEIAAPEDGLIVKKTDTARYRLSPGFPDAPLLLEDKIQWHWRILKWDGTYSGWTAYEDGQGHTFTAQPEDAGIYEVKATVEGQDFFLKRAKDDPHSVKKKGENECFGVVEQDWQVNVRNQAKANLGSVAYAKAGANDNVGKNEYKCNLFVGHKATDGGAPVPKINGNNPFNKYYPIANQWAGTQVASIPGWALLPEQTYPQPGYVVARGAPGGIGHTGFVDYDSAWIGAGTFNVNRKADLRNNISLRSGTATYQPARFHKYTP